MIIIITEAIRETSKPVLRVKYVESSVITY